MAERHEDFSIRQSASPASDSAANSTADHALGTSAERTTTGDVVGETVGGLSGAATGAALGSLGGPIGTIIGGIAGAVTGWWSGRAISEAASSFDTDEDFYRNDFTSRGAGAGSSTGSSYDTARPAYQLGHLAGMNPDYQGRQFDDVEPDLRRGYESYAGSNQGPAWTDVRSYAADAYNRGSTRGMQGSGAADRATHGGLLDRAADKLDDLKDRVDGNPASRPGPDPTDRRI